jgi:hypothetical protein
MAAKIELTDHQRAFHMAEFQKLNAEIAELIKSASQLLSVAVAASGALFAWLLASDVPSDLRELGSAIPVLLASTLGVMAFAQGERIKQMGSYLGELEDRLGDPVLGWEKHFGPKQAVIGIATMSAWVILLAGNVIGAAAIICLP